MAPTTLITFRLSLSLSVRTVELLGSWDNFTQSYPLERDSRAGEGLWRGCHQFKNISCDGLKLDPSVTRDGGLKMGGTYWYFYRLDGEIEYIDPLEPSTTSCPLLPGQQVNILEVPVQFQSPSQDKQEDTLSCVDSNVFTMDPQAKYISAKSSLPSAASPPLRLIHQRVSTKSPSSRDLPLMARLPTQTDDLDGRGECKRQTQSASTSCGFPGKATIKAAFYRMRGNKSTGALSHQKPKHGKEIVRTDSLRLTRQPCRDIPIRIDNIGKTRGRNMRAPVNTPQSRSARVFPEKAVFMHCIPSPRKSLSSHTGDKTSIEALGHASPTTAVGRQEDRTSVLPSSSSILSETTRYYTLSNHSQRHSRFLSEGAGPNVSERRHRGDNDSETIARNRAETESHASAASSESYRGEDDLRRDSFVSFPTSISHKHSSLQLPIQTAHATNRSESETGHSPEESDPWIRQSTRLPKLTCPPAGEFISLLNVASSDYGQLSPYQLSQPDSPSVRDFEAETDITGQSTSDTRDHSFDSLSKPTKTEEQSTWELHGTPRAFTGGFQGYSLPEDEHASATTLRKHPSSIFSPASHETTSNDQNRNELIQSWNDGSHHPMSALQELVEDLGYLGQVIT